jgi:hypothetical protein
MTASTYSAGTYAASTVAMPCPNGTTNSAGNFSSVSDCSGILPGWALTLGSHTLVSDVTACSTVDFYCPGRLGALTLSSDVAMTATATAGTYTSSAVALGCPTGLTNLATNEVVLSLTWHRCKGDPPVVLAD